MAGKLFRAIFPPLRVSSVGGPYHSRSFLFASTLRSQSCLSTHHCSPTPPQTQGPPRSAFDPASYGHLVLLFEGQHKHLILANAMKSLRAFAGQKVVLFLLSVLLSSRFCNICEADDTTSAKKISRACKGSTGTTVWFIRAWGVASVALALSLLFPFLQSWEPAEASSSMNHSPLKFISASQFRAGDRSTSSLQPRSDSETLSFKEAPSVRNGKDCPFCEVNSSEVEVVCDPSIVHVAMTLDTVYLRGSMAAVFSILQHASCPESIVFHFLVTENNGHFHALMRSTFPFLKFKIYHFDTDLVRGRISASVRQALEQPLNYARNYLADLLEPCVGRVIYLDSDLVVVDDIVKLWNTKLGLHVVGAPEYCHANFSKYFSPTFWTDAELSSTFEGRTPCYFNTGVMIVDLLKWRQQNCTRKIEQWMEIQKDRRIYELGSLPPYLLVFAGFVEPVEHRWNQHGLGGDNVKGSCRPLHSGPVSLLHWSGEGKPWTRLDSCQPCPLDSLWAPYDLFVNSTQ
ncbi:hypothetical protein L7F22_058981 [Adiantum nelumboides]|nr:hypothetical protein [Adiantum nelumboides]